MPTTRRLFEAKPSDEADRDLLRIQELFHGLIRSRAREGEIPIPRRLPNLERQMVDEAEPRWFPVPGMYGGFKYELRRDGVSPVLHVSSWSRVADGSGMRHHISPTQAILVEQGMV